MIDRQAVTVGHPCSDNAAEAACGVTELVWLVQAWCALSDDSWEQGRHEGVGERWRRHAQELVDLTYRTTLVVKSRKDGTTDPNKLIVEARFMGIRDLGERLHKEVPWLGKRTPFESLDLQDANLQFTHLPSSDLRRTDLRGANLCGAYLCGVKLRGATMWDARLRGAKLANTAIRDVDLLNADLRGVIMWGATIWSVDLDDAKLKGADLRGTNLMGWDLDAVSLDDETYDGETKLPVGFDPAAHRMKKVEEMDDLWDARTG